MYIISGYFKSLGADLVLDMTVAEDISILEAQQEFLQRYHDQQDDATTKKLPMLSSSCPGNLKIYFFHIDFRQKYFLIIKIVAFLGFCTFLRKK